MTVLQVLQHDPVIALAIAIFLGTLLAVWGLIHWWVQYQLRGLDELEQEFGSWDGL